MSSDEISALRRELREAIDGLRDALTAQVSRLIAEVAEVAKAQAVSDALAAVAAKQVCKSPSACLDLIPRVDALEESVADIRQSRAVEEAERKADRRALIRILAVIAGIGQAAAILTGLALQYYGTR
jgi:hypothetical protein